MHIVGAVEVSKAVATYNPTITQFEKFVRHTFCPSVALPFYALFCMCITHGPHGCSISLLQRGPLLSIFVCKVTTVRKNLIKPIDCFKYSCWYLFLSHTISFHRIMFLMYSTGIFHKVIIYVSRVSTKYREKLSESCHLTTYNQIFVT